jgi:hypothetical protein
MILKRSLLATALAFAFLVAAPPAKAEHAHVSVDVRGVDAALGEILQELARLEGVSEGANLSTCRRMHGDIASLRRRVAALQTELRAMPGVSMSLSVSVTDGGTETRERRRRDIAPAPPPPAPDPVVVAEPAPAAPQVISEADLSRLIARIEAESFSSGKLRVLDDAADYAWLTSAQTVRILGLFSFSSDQLKALELIVRNIVDPENAFEIYGAFTFDSDKEKARQILRSAR